jgi:outer membrane protein assembly factor BamB
VVTALDRASGDVAWEYDGGTLGGVGMTAALRDGRLYVPISGYIFDASDGTDLGRFTSESTPVFGDGVTIYATHEGVVQGVSTETGRSVWTFDPEGDTTSAPLLVGSTVYFGTGDGTVYGLDEATGGVQWTGDAGGSVRPIYDGRPFPNPGLGAGSGFLFVPTETGLAAFRSVG